MKLQSEQILQQGEINQFFYHEVMRIEAGKFVLFKHDDSSINRAWPSDSGGYISLFVLPYQSQQVKPSAQDRRAMYQNRPKAADKPKQNLPQWAATKQRIREAGWKFHISIAQDGENVSKAWNILVPILLKYKIGQTKIVKPENHQAANKIITVYTFNGGPALDNTEGRKPILYDFPVDPPDDFIMFVESDPDQILLLVEFLETTPKPGIYLPIGTTEIIRKQIENFTSLELPPEQDDDFETTPSCKL